MNKNEIESVISEEASLTEIQFNHILLDLMKLRHSKGLSKKQLADKAGISHTTVARIENFEMIPSLKMVIDILNVYGLTLNIEPVLCKTNEVETLRRIVLKKLCEEIDLLLKTEINYSEFIKGLFDSYYAILCEYSVDKSISNAIKRFGIYLSLVLSEYNRGQHTAAYTLFKEAINSCIDLSRFLRSFNSPKTMYRCRKKKPGKKYNKEDMFHIAYNQRYKIRTERYSYPGLPCLYLGESVDVCASELSCNKEDLVIATIQYTGTDKYKIFDLTSILSEDSTTYDDESFFRNIILLIVCSTNHTLSYDNNVEYKEEYVFPQLLLEYVINETTLEDETILGIKYYSVKFDFIRSWLNGYMERMKMMINYVFPARENNKKDNFCPLLKSCFDIIDIKNELL